MKSHASLLLLLAALPATAQDGPPGDGPRGSSQLAQGEVRYDAVGYAGRAEVAGVATVSSVLPAGSYAEVTALDSGRTIVVAVTGGDVAPGEVAMLSDAAAAALGMTASRFAVRVRRVSPTPQDMAALRAGQAASFRADAPTALLTALRKKLPQATATALSRPARAVSPAKPGQITTPATRSAPAAKPVPAPAPPLRNGYVVQVAALSSAARASALAKALGGSVTSGPPVWRVRLGPFVDAAAAARAKADVARKGYPGAQISRLP